MTTCPLKWADPHYFLFVTNSASRYQCVVRALFIFGGTMATTNDDLGEIQRINWFQELQSQRRRRIELK